MKRILIFLACLATLGVKAQQSVPTIRSEINTYFPSTNAKVIQAVKLRETFNDLLDHIDTLNKKRYTKSIAATRLINNTNYELVYITDTGKEGWFQYVAGSTASDDNNNTIVAANGRRYIRAAVLATSITDGAVSNAKLANAPANTMKGNNTGSSAVVQDLTTSQVRTLLSINNTDNTSDANKPISTATQTALNTKQANIQWRDEGSNVGLSGEIVTYNIVGSTAALTNSGNIATLTITEPVSLVVAASDEVTPLTTGTKLTFRMPHAMALTGVKASLTTAQASGSLLTVDIREGGTTVLSTLITLDNTERTSTTAATLPVISDSSLADDSEITIVITQVGASTVAAGLKVTLLGTR